MKLPLTVACWDYDRTRALLDGAIQIEGCEANYLPLPVEETFFRALRQQEFDVAELSMSSYTMQLARGDAHYVAIPVFLSRMFRHSAIYVRADAGITHPAQLKGRQVGVPEYQLTAPVWVRGLLQDEHGLAPEDIHWRTGGVEQAGRHEKVELPATVRARVEPIGPDQTLNRWLLDGRIDALVAPRAPSAFDAPGGQVVRLYQDLRGAEQDYFRRTGIFPIMHVVGLRRALVERHPWLAASVYKAFVAAKDRALRELGEVAALKTSLPWLASEVEETRALMGPDFWSYGLQPNRKTLQAFLRYHHEQGLSPRQLQAEELFAPSTLEQFAI